jgi:hypothetical protein
MNNVRLEVLFLMAFLLIGGFFASLALSPLFGTTGYIASDRVVSNIRLEPEYLVVAPGGDLIVQLDLYQFGEGNRRDLVVKTGLLDSSNVFIQLQENTLALETAASTVLHLYIPPALSHGTYSLNIVLSDARTGSVVAESSQRIYIKKPYSFSSLEKMLPIFVIVLCLIVLFFIIYLIRIYRLMSPALHH